MIPREKIIDTAKRVYRSYGFTPIDTPVLEHLEILTGKGSEETDRQMYSFNDHGDRPVGMRFDLTIPLARFAAQHIATLGTPFKRYHIAPVWRGENPQAGRYREFLQCDFDTIGTESVIADIETGLVIHDLLDAIGIQDFTIKINNRQILSGLLQKYDLSDKSVPILRCLDKLDKIGAEAVSREMQAAAEVTAEQADQVLGLATISGDPTSMLQQTQTLVAGNELGENGVQRLRELVVAFEDVGIAKQRYQIDVSIARGLDYYTGVIFETTLGSLPSIGSVCSGGRYDNLAGLYTKQHLPGIGASLGLDRLIAAMESLELLPKSRTVAPLMIAYFDAERRAEYLAISRILRSAGIGVELYPDAKKLGAQLKYADSRGFRFAVIAGSDELDRGTCQIKNLATKQSEELNWKETPVDFVARVSEMLDDV
ncbi:MAG TPA: histidine--tRNA ligase [Planctomycetaceae bacterium]|nr:histidine--tRNA ligase [Planctomycetaceae bacterium]